MDHSFRPGICSRLAAASACLRYGTDRAHGHGEERTSAAQRVRRVKACVYVLCVCVTECAGVGCGLCLVRYKTYRLGQQHVVERAKLHVERGLPDAVVVVRVEQLDQRVRRLAYSKTKESAKERECERKTESVCERGREGKKERERRERERNKVHRKRECVCV